MASQDLVHPAENLLIKSFRRNYNFPFLQHNFRLSSLLSHSVVLLASFNFLLAAVSIASILIRRNPTCRCRFASHTRHKNLSPRSRSKMFLIFSHKNSNSLKILMWINFFCCSRRWFSPKQFSQRTFTANDRKWPQRRNVEHFARWAIFNSHFHTQQNVVQALFIDLYSIFRVDSN